MIGEPAAPVARHASTRVVRPAAPDPWPASEAPLLGILFDASRWTRQRSPPSNTLIRETGSLRRADVQLRSQRRLPAPGLP